MRTAKLIKASPNAQALINAPAILRRPRNSVAQTTDAVTTWVKDFQREKPANPRQQFARLFEART